MARDEALIRQVTRTIVEHFHPRRIILFGSQARGDAGPDSDMDLFIEMDTPSRRKTATDISMLFGLRILGNGHHHLHPRRSRAVFRTSWFNFIHRGNRRESSV